MDTKKTATFAGAARLVGAAETTLRSACSAGHIATVELGCGQKVVVIASAKAWAKARRKPAAR